MAAHVGDSNAGAGAGAGGASGPLRHVSAGATAPLADPASTHDGGGATDAGADAREHDRLRSEWARVPQPQWRHWTPQQQRLYALARCCLAAADTAAAVTQPAARLPTPLQSLQPPLTAAAYSALHAALSGLLCRAAATPHEDLDSVLGQEPLPQLRGALQRLARIWDRAAAAASVGGMGDAGMAGREEGGVRGDSDGGSGSSSDSDDDCTDVDTMLAGPAPTAAAAVAAAGAGAGATAGCWYATARLHAAASSIVRGEVACLAAALLATCYSHLGAAAATASAPGCSTSLYPRAVAAAPAAGFNLDAIEEYADSNFVARRAGAGSGGGGGGGGVNGSAAEPLLQPQLRAVSALVAAGCPVLGAHLVQALQAGTPAAPPARLPSSPAGGANAMEGEGSDGSGNGGGGRAAVVGWPRRIEVRWPLYGWAGLCQWAAVQIRACTAGCACRFRSLCSCGLVVWKVIRATLRHGFRR